MDPGIGADRLRAACFIPEWMFKSATLACAPVCLTHWNPLGTIHVQHEGIVPGGTYRIEVVSCGCAEAPAGLWSAPLTLTTSPWGDVSGPFVAGLWMAPDGRVDISVDAIAVLEKFAGRPNAPAKVRVDVEPRSLDFKINITDVTRVLDAFRGLAYPFAPSTASPCG